MKKAVMWFFIAAFILALPSLVCASSPEVDKLIREGIELHDQGYYLTAIIKYKAALSIDPYNPYALYEMALSYTAAGKYAECIAAAGKGLEEESNIESMLYGIQASCYSAKGDVEQAFETYQCGLIKYPEDPMLNYSLAITYIGEDMYYAASVYLKQAIRGKTVFPSPYFYLGQIFQHEGYRIPSFFVYLRFFMLEPDTPRAVFAAQRVYELMHGSTVDEETGDIQVVIPSDSSRIEGDFSRLEVLLTLSSVNLQSMDNADQSDAEIFVNQLKNFIQVCMELDNQPVYDTFTWKCAMKDVLWLNEIGLMEPFAYYVAARLKLDGAVDWLDNHPKEWDKLDKTLMQLWE